MGYQGVNIAGASGANGSIFSAFSTGCEAPAVPAPPYQVLNIRYDLTSMRNVSAVITEVGLIPPTSIPVLIRELRLDQR
jgi:translation initiation factor 2B subunit (eIF-2B alpha/beta/delta family)